MSDWRHVVVIVASTASIYVTLLVLLRVAGRRLLAELTVVDLVVVLVLGSCVETAMIHGDTSLTAGLVAATTLLVGNKLLSLGMVRVRWFRQAVNGGPVLLAHRGRLLDNHLRRQGLTSDDVLEAIRGRGYGDLSSVRYAVLETDGSITVVPQQNAPEPPLR